MTFLPYYLKFQFKHSVLLILVAGCMGGRWERGGGNFWKSFFLLFFLLYHFLLICLFFIVISHFFYFSFFNFREGEYQKYHNIMKNTVPRLVETCLGSDVVFNFEIAQPWLFHFSLNQDGFVSSTCEVRFVERILI